ncbi:MAG: hypothetical protein KDA21_13775, partial [Phycisphaerales bacterium]|nr:hypothetical protein [Phycisphaerales bacterium]
LYGGFTTEGRGATSLVTIDPAAQTVTIVGATGIDSPIGGIAHNPCTGHTYVVSSGGSTGRLYRLNLGTGAATLVGDVSLNGAAIKLTALEFSGDGTLYALPNAASGPQGHLLRLDPTTAIATDLGYLGVEVLSSLTADIPACDCGGADVNNDGSVDFTDLNDLLDAWGDACGIMYSHTSSSGELHTVDIQTAATTLIGTDFPHAGDSPAEAEFADGVIYVSRQWFRSLDPATGQILTEFQPTWPTKGNAVTAMEEVDGTLYGALTNSGLGASSTLITINPVTGASVVVGPTGFGALGGMAFDPCNQVMYGVTSAGSEAELLVIDLNSGAAASLGTITVNGGNVRLTALEFGADGELYTMPNTLDPFWPNLLRIDRSTLQATIVGNTNLPLYAAMLTANPDTTCEGADVNGDGAVNFTDLNILLDEWGNHCMPEAR